MSLMNHVLQPFLRKFVVVFLDDILIYSRSWKEHLQHIRAVMTCLRKNQLYCKPKECDFGATQAQFLGHLVTGTTLAPDPAKLEAVKTWSSPSSVPEVRRFLGFANYFRRLIKGYSHIFRPLEEMTGRFVKFSWTQEREEAFLRLKDRLMTAPVLHLADGIKALRVITDASDLAVRGVLLQESKHGEWHPVAYMSRRLTLAERNYGCSHSYFFQQIAMYNFLRNTISRGNHLNRVTGGLFVRCVPTTTRALPRGHYSASTSAPEI